MIKDKNVVKALNKEQTSAHIEEKRSSTLQWVNRRINAIRNGIKRMLK